ncbi:hypothetical protein ABVT39_014486 [Epinephelus coioides]
MSDGCSGRLTPKHRRLEVKVKVKVSIVGFRAGIRLQLEIGLLVFCISLRAVEFGRLSTHKGKQDDILAYSEHQLHVSAFIPEFIIEKKTVK